MANGDLVRFRQGSRADVVSTAKQAGQLLFATYEDEVITTQGAESFVQGDIYFDLSDGPSGIRVNLANDVDKARTLFAGHTSTSDTAGQWTATIDGITKLYDGLTIVLRLNTSYNSTFNSLNVNGLGAKLVWYRKNSRLTSHVPNGAEILLVYRTVAGSYTVSSTSTRTDIPANTVCTDGWIMATSYADGNTIPSAYCSTGASTTAKTASCSGYAATANHYIHIIFSNTNTANVPTLNINSTGAKPIYLNGQPVSSSNKNIEKGSYIAYYDGTAYYLRNDGILPGRIEKAILADTASALANGVNIVVGSIDSNNHLPNATNTYNLGNSSKIWKQLYVGDVIASNEIQGASLAITTNATVGGNLTVSGTINATINGNATSATGFANAKTIALTGDVTGSANGGDGNNGWSIATTIGTGKVTNDMLAGNITNAKLVNAEIGIAGNQVALGSGIAASTLLSSLGLSSAMHFIGVSTTAISDGVTTSPITVGGSSHTPTAGDVVIYGNNEYVWTSGGAWELLGQDGSFKVVQTAYDSSSITSANANTSLVVSDVSQNAQGVITVTKKNVITPQSLIIKANGSSAENAGYWSFDGSTVRTINFVPGTGISITGSNGQITIANTIEDTHHTATMYLANSATAKSNITAATQNPYLNLVENDTVRKSIRFEAGGQATVEGSADASKIVFSAPDQRVLQGATTTDQWRKVLLHYTTNTSGGNVPADTINQVYAAKGVEVQPSTGTIKATGVTATSVFNYSGISAASDAVDRYVWFSYNGTPGRPVYNADFKYNPGTNTLTVGTVSGNLSGNATTATTATKVGNSLVLKIPKPSGDTDWTEGTNKWTFDGETNKSITISAGSGITLTGDANSGFTIASTAIGTDDKVKQINTTSNSNYRVLLSYGANDNEETNQAYKSAQLLFNPYTKTVTAENFAGTATTALSAGAFSSNATVTLTGDTTGTSAGSTKSWSVPTVTKYISGLGRRTSAAAIALNPSVDTGFKMTWHISDSTSRTNDATNSPSFDAAIINLPWDWGGYNGQIAISNTAASNTRMQIRSATSVDNGSSANPRYTPNYGAWREVVTATKATQIGSSSAPIYISNTGQATACGDSLDVSITGNAATATTVLWSGINNKPETATRWPKWNEITQQGANSIEEGTSDFTDNTEIFSSYASNNGFADTNATGKVYRRDAIKMYNYIKTKAGTSGSGFNIAGSSASCTGNAASADKVNSSLVIKVSDGNAETEGTNKWTFDGSTPQLITIAAGTGISLTGNTNTGFTITNTARDSHYTTAMYLGASNSATTNNASNTTSPYLMVLDNSTVRNRIQFTGSGATTVTGTASSNNPTGTVTISSTDENVQQLIDNSGNVNYKLLLTKEANTQNTVGATHFSTNLMFNPSTGMLSGQNLTLSGTLSVGQGSTFTGAITANGGLTVTDLSVTGNAAFSVTPTAPTAAAGTNDTTLATTAFVNAALQSGAMGNGSPLKVARYDGTGGVIEAAPQHTVNNYQYVINDATAGGQSPAFKLVGKNYTIWFGIGSGNDNRGIFDATSSINKWLLYWDANNYAILNSGKLGVNGSNTSYNFYVNGSSFFNGNILNTGNTTHNGIVYFANGTTYYVNNSAQGYLANLSVGTGSSTSYKLYVAGESYFNGNVNTKNIYHWNANAVQDGSWVTETTGTASVTGTNILTLGNATATGTANNAKGYLRIYGGSTGYAEITYNDTRLQSDKSLYFSTSTTSGISNEVRGIMATNDYWRIAGGATAANSGYLEIATANEGTEPIYVRQYANDFSSATRTLTLLDASGNSEFPGYIKRVFSASNQEPMLWMNGMDYDNYLFQISSGSASGKQYYGYAMKYIGTGSGAANYLQLLADNQNGTDVIAIGIDQAGRVGIGDNASTDYRLYVNGDSQFKGSLLPQATDTYDLGSAALRWKTMYVSQFNPDYTYKNSSTVTVKASEWTNIIAGNTTGLDDGTYIIQLKITSTSNTAYYSGICSWIKATSSAVNTYSEIPLHAVQKGLANQFYLRTAIDGSGIYLQISQTASANTSLAANAITISFKKIM